MEQKYLITLHLPAYDTVTLRVTLKLNVYVWHQVNQVHNIFMTFQEHIFFV